MISLQTHTLEIFLLPSNICICFSWDFFWKFFLWKTRLVMSPLLYREGKKKSYVLWHPLLSSGQCWLTKFNFNRRKKQFSLGTPRKGRGITFTKVLTCAGIRLHRPHVRWSPPQAAQLWLSHSSSISVSWDTVDLCLLRAGQNMLAVDTRSSDSGIRHHLPSFFMSWTRWSPRLSSMVFIPWL